MARHLKEDKAVVALVRCPLASARATHPTTAPARPGAHRTTLASGLARMRPPVRHPTHPSTHTHQAAAGRAINYGYIHTGTRKG